MRKWLATPCSAAAEIAETYPDKQVTLVQANKELVPGYSARLSRQILNILKGLNVEASWHSESIAGKCHVQEVAWTIDWCFLLVSRCGHSSSLPSESATGH